MVHGRESAVVARSGPGVKVGVGGLVQLEEESLQHVGHRLAVPTIRAKGEEWRLACARDGPLPSLEHALVHVRAGQGQPQRAGREGRRGREEAGGRDWGLGMIGGEEMT